MTFLWLFIMTGDETRMHCHNRKYIYLWAKPGHASPSVAKLNIHGSQITLCIWKYHLGPVYYGKLKLNYHQKTFAITTAAFKHWRKNGRYMSRHTTKWFCKMTALGHMLQHRRKHTSKRLNSKSYTICCIHQTLLLTNRTCSAPTE